MPGYPPGGRGKEGRALGHLGVLLVLFTFIGVKVFKVGPPL